MEQEAVTLVTSQIELFGAFGLAMVIVIVVAVVCFRLYIQERDNCKEMAANLVTDRIQSLELVNEFKITVTSLTQSLTSSKEAIDRMAVEVNGLKSKIDQCRVNDGR